VELSLKCLLPFLSQLGLIELPRAVDGPMAKKPVTLKCQTLSVERGWACMNIDEAAHGELTARSARGVGSGRGEGGTG
jgi:hypothetical protein